jgi:hypothetical protein
VAPVARLVADDVARPGLSISARRIDATSLLFVVRKKGLT